MERRDFLKLVSLSALGIPLSVGFAKSSGRRVFLTIDDSPKERTTYEMMKVLENFGIKATFFCIGWRLVKFKGIAKDLLKEGHTLGNHSYTHLSFSSLEFPRRVKEISYTDRVLRRINLECGRPHKRIWRFPYGDTGGDPRIFGFLKREKYKVIGWNVDSQDWRYYSNHHPLPLKEIMRRSIAHGRDVVILLHDIPITAKKVIPYIVSYYLDMGYRFERL